MTTPLVNAAAATVGRFACVVNIVVPSTFTSTITDAPVGAVPDVPLVRLRELQFEHVLLVPGLDRAVRVDDSAQRRAGGVDRDLGLLVAVPVQIVDE